MSNLHIQQVHMQSLAGWWFLTCQNKVLCVPQGQRVPFGQVDELTIDNALLLNAEYFADYQGEPCYRLALEETVDVGLGEWLDLYSLISELDEPLFMLAGRALQHALFLQTHRFCGQCGQIMTRVDWELAMQCKDCGFRAYPRISPSIIVAIRRDDQILLACHKRHSQSKDKDRLYTVLAGFVEAGETLEQCLHREVKEEVNLKVHNVRYQGSQPWPFPHSMMVGYIADYLKGNIQVQRSELLEANWYHIDELPRLPHPGTIARSMIDTLVAQISNQQ